MWPFDRVAQDVVEPTPPKRQRMPNDVLDKLLLLIHTREIMVSPNSKRGGSCVVGGVIHIADYEGVMKIEVGGNEITIYRRFDLEFDIICDALNKRFTGKTHSGTLSINPTDAFNEVIMKL